MMKEGFGALRVVETRKGERGEEKKEKRESPGKARVLGCVWSRGEICKGW